MSLIDLPTVPVEWHDMTSVERADHRDACEDLCDTCEAYRVFGVCPACGPGREGDTEERCLACEWLLILESDPADQASWWLESA